MIDSQQVDVSFATLIFAYDYQSWRDNYLFLCESGRYPIVSRMRRLDRFLLDEKAS